MNKDIIAILVHGAVAIALVVGLILGHVSGAEFGASLALLFAPSPITTARRLFGRPPDPPNDGPPTEREPKLRQTPAPKMAARASISKLWCALIVVAACKGGASVPTIDADAAGPYLDAATQGVSDICSLIEGIDDNGAVRTICATVEEIAEIVTVVLTLRDARDAGPPARAQCAYLPGSTFCATSAERAKGILFVVRERQARLMLDAGAR